MTDVLQSTHMLLSHAAGRGRPVCYNHKLIFQRVRVWTAVMNKSHVIIPHTRVWRNYELQSSRWEPQYHESVIGFWAQSIDITYSAFEILKSNPKLNPKWWSKLRSVHYPAYLQLWSVMATGGPCSYYPLSLLTNEAIRETYSDQEIFLSRPHPSKWWSTAPFLSNQMQIKSSKIQNL